MSDELKMLECKADEALSLRLGEQVRVYDEPPEGASVWFAVQARSVDMPDGDRVDLSESGWPIVQAAIVACLKVDGMWQWLHLGPELKEAVGNVIIESELERDRWHYAAITPMTLTPAR